MRENQFNCSFNRRIYIVTDDMFDRFVNSQIFNPKFLNSMNPCSYFRGIIYYRNKVILDYTYSKP